MFKAGVVVKNIALHTLAWDNEIRLEVSFCWFSKKGRESKKFSLFSDRSSND